MSRRRVGAGLSTLALASASALAFSATAIAQSARPTFNLYGNTGLIDLPTAESQPDGQLSFSYGYFGGTTRRNLNFQVLPRVSGTLRYSTIENWGRPDDPGYDLFDRSFDLKIQILQDRGRWQPSLAIGLRDFLGTGVYSSEYVVATKQVTPSLKVTGGIGWGRLGSANGFKNPFCSLTDRACERDRDFGEGGTLAFDSYFRGENAAPFGGVEWATPIEGLTLKAEYSSDAYAREQRGVEAEFERKSDFNFGAQYRIADHVELGAYYMYGSELGFNVSFSGNPGKPPVPQNFAPGPVPVLARPPEVSRSGAWARNPQARDTLAEGISKVLSAEGITLERMRFEAEAVDVFIDNRRINQMPKAIGRTARVLAAGLPPSVERFRITPVEDGLPTTTIEIDRSTLEAQVDRPGAGLASWRTTGFRGAVPALGGEVWTRDIYPDIDWLIAPVPDVQIFAGEDGFRPQLTLEARGSVEFAPGLSASARIRQPVLGAFDDPGVAEGPRALPPVRRESGRYYSGNDPKLIRLTGDYIFKLNRDIYARASAGYLERQFAGISGEVLWKPVDQDWGLGLEVNQVRQREPDAFLGFRNYDVTTGHASLYWETGYKGMGVQVDAGRYLAKDWGATLTVTRRFASGWEVGAFATKTDVSSEDFGEGSFDKGIILSIPLRWATPFETRQTIDSQLRSLSSDGGARLRVYNRLYPTIRDLSRSGLERNWGAFWQ